jgi:hypothetical protein
MWFGVWCQAPSKKQAKDKKKSKKSKAAEARVPGTTNETAPGTMLYLAHLLQSISIKKSTAG